MTLDEAIEHYEKVAEMNDVIANEAGEENWTIMFECQKCAEEHKQLAEWLKELKNYKKNYRWIPVTEQLPKLNSKVVCKCQANIYEVLKLTIDGWCYDTTRCYMMGFVIAWMPLLEESEELNAETD